MLQFISSLLHNLSSRAVYRLLLPPPSATPVRKHLVQQHGQKFFRRNRTRHRRRLRGSSGNGSDKSTPGRCLPTRRVPDRLRVLRLQPPGVRRRESFLRMDGRLLHPATPRAGPGDIPIAGRTTVVLRSVPGSNERGEWPSRMRDTSAQLREEITAFDTFTICENTMCLGPGVVVQ